MRKQSSTTYRGYRTAGIRLTEEVQAGLEAPAVDTKRATTQAIHQFDKAHLVMLAEESLIPRAAAVAMLRELRETERTGIEQPRNEAGGGLHSAENLLIRRLGEEVGGWIHLGRSSGDLDAVATATVQRDRLLETIAGLLAFRRVLLSLAEAHAGSVMPGYTQGQQAQPVTLGHELTAWASVFARDTERCQQAYDRVNESAAGAAIMSGSDVPLDRERTSDLLGFARPIANTYDAILSRDRQLETFGVLALLTANLGRLADDIMLWATIEFGMVEIPDRYCGTSSIMMHKRNPLPPQYTRGLATASLGGLVTAFHVEKGPTGWAIDDRSYSRETHWRLFNDTVHYLGLWCEFLPALRWNIALMRERAGAHWATATDIAAALVRERGLPWRTAHQIVGILVRRSQERGHGPADVTPTMLDEAAVEYLGKPVGLAPETLRLALDPTHFVESRSLLGGPARVDVLRQVNDARRRIELDEARADTERAKVAAARQRLEQAIDALLAPG